MICFVKNRSMLTRKRHKNCNKNLYLLYEPYNQSYTEAAQSEVQSRDFDKSIKNNDEILSGYIGV